MPSLTAARAAGERRVDVAWNDEQVGLALEQHLLDADERAGRLLAVRARADAEEDVRLGQPELVRNTSDISAS